MHKDAHDRNLDKKSLKPGGRFECAFRKVYPGPNLFKLGMMGICPSDLEDPTALVNAARSSAAGAHLGEEPTGIWGATAGQAPPFEAAC